MLLPYGQMLSNGRLYINLGSTSNGLSVNLTQCYYFALNKAVWIFVFIMHYFKPNIQHISD